MLPNPAEWFNQVAHNKCGANGKTSQPQLYQCSSECSDHSLKAHSQHSHSSHSHHSHEKGGKGKRKCSERHQQQPHGPPPPESAKTGNGSNGNESDNIYENDEEVSEREQMIANNSLSYPAVSDTDRHSDCCSSMGDPEGDTCCSCSESSCLYAEAGEPTRQPQIVKANGN